HCDREFLICVECRGFLELLLDTHDSVWFFVPINPGYLFPGLHRDGLRIEGKFFDLDFILTDAIVASVLHLARQGGKREAGKKRWDGNFGNDRIDRFEFLWFLDLTKG